MSNLVINVTSGSHFSERLRVGKSGKHVIAGVY